MSGLRMIIKNTISIFHNEEIAKRAKEVIIPTIQEKGRWIGEHQLQNHVTDEIFDTLANVFLLKTHIHKGLLLEQSFRQILQNVNKEEYNLFLQTLINHLMLCKFHNYRRKVCVYE
jgi:hypothetical protein